MPGGATPNLPLDRFAALTALIDVGRMRDDVLEAAGLTDELWLDEQGAWLDQMAAQARLQRFELQIRFNDILLSLLAALEQGEQLTVQDGVRLGRSPSQRPSGAAAVVAAAPAPAPAAPAPAPVAATAVAPPHATPSATAPPAPAAQTSPASRAVLPFSGASNLASPAAKQPLAAPEKGASVQAGLPFRAGGSSSSSSPPPVHIEEPHVDLGKTLGAGDFVAPKIEVRGEALAVKTKAPAVDLTRTVMVNDVVPVRALPFAGATNVTLPFRAVPASGVPASGAPDDGALPFSRKSGDAAEDLSRAVAVPKSSGEAKPKSSGEAKPRLTLEQFASLSAEIGVHPERKAEVERRYGLDATTHDLEKRAWAMEFFDDREVAERYKAMRQEYRQWLEREAST